jgi:hypothetical protein
MKAIAHGSLSCATALTWKGRPFEAAGATLLPLSTVSPVALQAVMSKADAEARKKARMISSWGRLTGAGLGNSRGNGMKFR